jgi:hypothetical protein
MPAINRSISISSSDFGTRSSAVAIGRIESISQGCP